MMKMAVDSESGIPINGKKISKKKVNEEVDALVTMGFDPTQFLAVPKVLAAMVVVPILTLYSDFFWHCRRFGCRGPWARSDGLYERGISSKDKWMNSWRRAKRMAERLSSV